LKTMKITLVSVRASLLLLVFSFIADPRLAVAAGRVWAFYDSPNSGTTNLLSGVASISRSDAWAVGYAYEQDSEQITITQHWDGAAWTADTSPNPGTTEECGDASY